MKLLQQDLMEAQETFEVGSKHWNTIANARKKLEALEIVEDVVSDMEDCIDAVHMIDELQEELHDEDLI